MLFRSLGRIYQEFPARYVFYYPDKKGKHTSIFGDQLNKVTAKTWKDFVKEQKIHGSQKLFESDAKFESGTGWPSFDQAIPGSVIMKEDNSFGMHRTEVLCSKCGAHLGHMFEDGPKETTGQRFCINSCALDLKKKTK